MPKDKTASHERVVAAAKAEFLEKGFEKASIRSIAEAAGMTSAGLYRHFLDKEAMFASLVEPALEALRKMVESHTAHSYELISTGDLSSMWGEPNGLTLLLDIIYDHFDAFKLLLRCSAGTRFERFFDDIVEMEEKETLRYIETLRERGIPVNNIVPEELHLLLNAYCSAVFEVVVHDFPREEAKHYVATLQRFFNPGWQAFLGF